MSLPEKSNSFSVTLTLTGVRKRINCIRLENQRSQGLGSVVPIGSMT